MEKITWSALEHEEKERGPNWFWALGIIVFTAAAAAIIYNNYFFAALIILSGALLGFLATKKLEPVDYELNDKGFLVEKSLYPYENIKSFWVQRETFPEDNLEKLKPVLFIKSERLFMPVILAPIENTMANHIHDFLLGKNVIEEEMKEHFSLKIMEALGF
ncbi:MAG TPA: hypothetical protein VGO63_03040 [Candidatus Paceibacterota bacterium]|jgi:hypothetical protein|nr:hypothetical protein [Candidatus Paceibacterota bacterium]